MRRVCLTLAPIALILAIAGCGSSETKTVTETLAEKAAPVEEKTEVESEEPTASTIPDGVWAEGQDYKPGLYRAPGGGACYWALLNKANPNAIQENGGRNSTQTLEIESPYFETTGCGTWEKIG